MSGYSKRIEDYVALFGRRKRLFLVSALFVLASSVVAALVWPPVYRSMATVLIEQAEVPQNFVQSTVTSFASERLQVIKQRVTTTETLTGLMDRYKLYGELRQTEPLTAVVERFREDIALEMVDARVVDPKSGRPVSATIAFSLAYDNPVPRIAQQVANELVSLFLSANIRERQQAVSETSEFLAREANRLAQDINELEAKLARFKMENAGQLPEQQAINLANVERAERDLSQVDMRLQGLQERQIFLDAQLAATEPYFNSTAATSKTLSLDDQLVALRGQYVRLLGAYGSGNPDVIRLKREIDALETETGGGRDVASIEAEFEQARIELAKARERYSAEHPDVRRFAREVDSLKADLAAARNRSVTNTSPTRTANPAYVTLGAQRHAVATELETLKAQRGALTQKIEEYQKRAIAFPEVEQRYRALVRDYDNTQARYKDIKDKQITAELAKSLETERKAERFSLIEPPLLPVDPIWPNRLAIIGIGAFLALVIGAGLVLLVDTFDDGIYGTRQLAWIVGEPPLVAVPYVVIPSERVRSVTLLCLWLTVSGLALAVALVAVHTYVMPLDVMWFRTVNQLGLRVFWR